MKLNVNACFTVLVFISSSTLNIRPFTQIPRADPAESLDLGDEWSVVPSGRLVEVRVQSYHAGMSEGSPEGDT